MRLLRSHFLFLALAAPLLGGCAVCASVDDYNYAAHGGRWQRDDPSHGRVGSLFTPVGHDVQGGEAEEVLINPVLIDET